MSSAVLIRGSAGQTEIIENYRTSAASDREGDLQKERRANELGEKVTRKGEKKGKISISSARKKNPRLQNTKGNSGVFKPRVQREKVGGGGGEQNFSSSYGSNRGRTERGNISAFTRNIEEVREMDSLPLKGKRGRERGDTFWRKKVVLFKRRAAKPEHPYVLFVEINKPRGRDRRECKKDPYHIGSATGKKRK